MEQETSVLVKEKWTVNGHHSRSGIIWPMAIQVESIVEGQKFRFIGGEQGVRGMIPEKLIFIK